MSAHGHDPLDVEPGDVVRVTAAGCPDGWAVEIVERVPKPVVERAVEVIRHASGYHLDGHHIAQALADANLLWPRDEHDELTRRVEELQARLELSPADFDVQTRGRAFEEALLVAGLAGLARIIRVLTDMASGDCPLHGRHPVDVWSAATPEQLTSLREDPEVAALHGPPIDGREVDTPPEGVDLDALLDSVDGKLRLLSSETEDGAASSSRAAAPHMWLGSPPSCRCLLGQDHVQDPIYAPSATAPQCGPGPSSPDCGDPLCVDCEEER